MNGQLKVSAKRIILISLILSTILAAMLVILTGKTALRKNYLNKNEEINKVDERMEKANQVGQKAIISSTQIIQKKTGVGPFDENDEPGNDSSADNDIVRSFDQITWTIENTMSLKSTATEESLKGGIIEIIAELPETCGDMVKWDVEAMAWAESPTVSADGRTFSAMYSMPEESVTVPGKQFLSLVVNVLDATNELEIEPTYSVKLVGNNENEKVEGIATKVKVSAAPSYNVRLGKGNLNYRSYFDFHAKDEVESLGDSTVYGRIQGYSVELQLFNPNSEKGLKGIEFPTGPITFDLTFTESIGTTDVTMQEGYTPVLWDYKENISTTKVGKNGNNMFWYGSNQTHYGNNVSALNSGGTKGFNACYNGGDWKIVQDDIKPNVYHVTVDNYEFDRKNYLFPTNYAGNGIGTEQKYSKNIGCFSSGFVQAILQMPEDTGKTNSIYFKATASNLNAMSVSGQESTDDKKPDDDMINKSITLYTGVGFGKYQTMQSKEAESGNFASTSGNNLSPTYYEGDSYLAKGDWFIISSYISSSSTNDGNMKRTNLLQKFDDKAFMPFEDANTESSLQKITINESSTLGDLKTLYAAKPDKTGWKDDDEMQDTREEDLIYFTTMQELIDKGYVCVGTLQENTNIIGYPGSFYYYAIKLKIKETAEIGKVYAVVSDARVWTENVDFSWENQEYTYDEENGLQYINLNYPKEGWREYNGISSSVPRYIKTAYDENGQIIDGTHFGGYRSGNSLLIVGADQKLNIETINPIDSTKKINYDLGKNEYDVTYKVTPKLSSQVSGETELTGVNLKVELTMPQGLTYVPGSCEYGEPEITPNEDGSSTLMWKKYNCTVGKNIEPIVYQAHISEETENGKQFEVTGVMAEIIAKGEQSKIGNPRLETRTASAGIQVTNLLSYSLYKTTTTPIIGINGNIHYKITCSNKTDIPINDFQLLDILPYNGDGRGTNFSGDYTVEKIELNTTSEAENNSNLELYLNSSEEIRINGDVKDENLIDSSWTKGISGASINLNLTALAVTGKLDKKTKLEIDIYINTNGNSPTDVYKNLAKVQTGKETEAMETSIISVGVIKRQLEGKVWFDGNKDGVITDGEKFLENIEVTLINEDGTPALDINGNTITPIKTDANGYYSFKNMNEGRYKVKVDVVGEEIEITHKNIGVNEEINSKFNSNGETDVLDKFNNLSSPLIDVKNINAGIAYKDGNVVVHHYLEGTSTSVGEDVNISGILYNEYITEPGKDVPEYYALVEEPENKTGTFTLETIEVTYYYRLKKYNYVINYLEKDNENNILAPQIQGEAELYGTKIDASDRKKDITGYIFDSINPEELTIGVTGNVINIYYTRRMDLSYTINYIEKGTDHVIHEPDIGNNQIFGTEVLASEKEIGIPGYKYDSSDKASITVGTDETKNVINMYYTRRNDIKYTIEYYYDGEQNEDAIETGVGTFESQIDTYTDKIKTGYKLDKVEGNPITLQADESKNVMKVYYVKDTFGYSIEYYYDGVIDAEKTDNLTATFGDSVTEYTDKNKTGYKLEKIENNPLTITEVSENNVMRIYYIKDSFEYTVEYYYAGAKDNTATETGSGVFQSEVDTYEDKVKDGYEFDKTENLPLTITEDKTQNIISVYYKKRTDLSYTVNYIDKDTGKPIDTAKVVNNVTFGDTITSSTEYKPFYGYNFDSYDKDTLTIGADESKNVINIYYTKKDAQVIVHHYLENTTTELAPDVAMPGKVGDNYTTGVGNVENKYEVVGIPANANGIMTEDTIEVTYYYRLKDTSVLVHYYIEGTSTSLSDDVLIEGKVDDDYNTTAATDIESKYELVATPSNASGTMTVAQTVVTYYYRLKESGVIVHYYVEGTTTQVSKDVTITGKVDDAYETIAATDVASKYEFVRIQGEASGKMTESQIVVIYYYRLKDTKVIVHHYLEGTTDSLAPDEEKLGQVDDAYTTLEATELLYKYNLVADPINKSGIMTEAAIEVTYYYSLKDTKVVVHHYEEGTTNKVGEDVIISGKVDDEYKTTVGQDVPEYYELVAEPENKDGTMTVETTEVTYYYRLKEYGYVVNYLEKDNEDNILVPQKQGVAQVYGTVIDAEAEVIPIDGYNVDSKVPESLTIGMTGNVINIYYTRKMDLTYTINYIEKNTTNVIHDPEIAENQIFGTEVLASSKEIPIDGYVYDSADKPSITVGTTSENNVINMYYTRRDDIKYTIEYYYDGVKDTTKTENGTGVFESQIDTYTNKPKTGYRFDKVEGNPITLVTDETKNVMKVYYVRDTFGYSIEYYYDGVRDDKKTDNLTATFGDSITDYTDKNITGYKLDRTENNPLLITEDSKKNVMKVYYVKDSFEYTVEYYYAGAKDEAATETGSGVFQSEIDTYKEKVKDGYVFDKTENLPLTITEDKTQNIISVYYKKRTDLSYIVNYIDKDTGKPIDTAKVVNNVTFGATITSSTEYKPFYGYNFDSYDKDTLTIGADESKNVINIYYTKKDAQVIVHHYLENTTTELAKDVTMPGKVGDNYTTGVGNVENKYEVVAIPENANGIMTEETIEVTYYYRLKDTSVLVHYYIEGTSTSLSDDVVITGKVDDTYTTTAATDIESKYELVATPSNASGTMTVAQTVVTYYYRLKESGVIVHYYVEGTTTQVSDDVVITGKVDDAYETIAATDVASKYEFVRIQGNATGTMLESQIVVIYYYRLKDTKVIVHHYLEGTTDSLAPDEEKLGQVDDAYTTLEVTELLYKYNLVADPVNKSGTMTEATIEVIYYYRLKDAQVVVHHYKEGTTDKIVPDVTINGKVDDSYTTTVDKGIPEYYRLVAEPENKAGTMTVEPIEVIYYYELKEYGYVVNYLEKDNEDNILAPQKQGVAQIYGTAIDAADEVIPVDGYYVDSKEPESLTIGVTGNVINIYYTKRNDINYTIEYYYDGTKDEDATESGVGTFESQITTYPDKVKTGYKLEKVEGNPITLVTDESKNVMKVYYVKDTFGYSIEYYYDGVRDDEKTDSFTETFGETVTDYEDKNITGYKLEKVENNPLTITEVSGNNVMRIYYIKDTFEYTVEYYYAGEKDEAETETGSGVFQSEVDSYTDKLKDGYEFDKTENLPLTITEDKTKNVIKVHYKKRSDIRYTIEYYYDGQKDGDATESGVGTFESQITTYQDKVKTGYKLEKVEGNPITLQADETKNVMRIYYVKDIFEYTVEYYYAGAKDDSLTETGSGVFQSEVDTYEDKVKDGYEFDKTENLPLTITEDKTKNVIKVHYKKRSDIRYTIEYYYDGEQDEDATESGVGTFESQITTYPDKIKTGYELDKVEGNPITLVTDESKNVMKVYYVKDTFGYSIEYYYDGVLDDTKTDSFTETFGEVVTEYEDKNITGYKLEKVENNPLTITEVAGNNVMRIYYIKDTFEYTVEYYYAGAKDDSLTETGSGVFQSEVDSYTDKVKDGYEFDKTENLPLTITEDKTKNVISVYYKKRSDIKYTIEYYYDGEQEGDATESGVGTFESQITTYPDKVKTGYKLEKVEGNPITLQADETKNVMKVYYVKDSFEYTVEYYYAGEKDEAATETGSGVFQSKVDTYKDKVKDGYEFDKTENLPLTITEDKTKNVIKVHYKKRSDLSYTVNHLEKGTNTPIHTAEVVKGMTFGEKVTSSDKAITIYGYKYDSVEEDFITIGTGANVINIYYTLKDTSVLVHHYIEGTTTSLSNDVVIEGKVFDSYETAMATDIPSKYELVAVPENAQGEMTEEQIVVTYYYRTKPAQVIVHHYEEGTTNKLSETVTIDGRVDDEYTTTAAKDIPIKYELVQVPENASGIMTEEDIEVTYYYRVKDTSLVVKYLEKGTNLELAEQEMQTGKVDEDYITGPKTIENYTLVGDTGNTTGKLTVDQITVIFYYLQNTSVTVQHIDKKTGEILEEYTTEGLVGDSYTATSKDFKYYVLVEKPEKETVTLAKDEIVLKYYYLKNVAGGVIEKHVNEYTGEILYNEVHTGEEGDPYNIEPRTFTGYDLVESKLPINSQGEMRIDSIEVTYYYHYRSRVVAEYVDMMTNKKLVEDVVLDGYEGDKYTTEGKQIDDYRLIEVPENANGTMTKAPIKVTYYYVHLTGGVIERHIDIMTGEQLVAEEKFDGYEGDIYKTKPENIPYYDLVEKKYPANAEGTMTIEQIIVNYYYVRQTEVNVKYVDKVTGEEIEKTKIISGHEGDNYATESKDITGFDLIEIPENKDGKMTKEAIEVTYYYARPAKVVVNYIDGDTNQNIVAEEVITGHQDDEYTTTSKDIQYYVLDKVPENSEGIMQVNIGKDEDGAEIVNDTTYVNYYYRKMEFNLKVDKTIGSVIVNGVEKQVNGNLGKVEIYRKELVTTKVQVVYNIVVTNNSELSGKAKLLENIPDGMTMKPEKNTLWKISQTVAELETEDLKPGESKTYKVVLDWAGGENNTGTKKNMVQITGTENEAGYEEKDKQDNTDTADLIVTVGTGEYTYVAGVGITIIVLAAIAVTVVARKKKE